ncbi:helix-turn-helix domain-containing protein [Spirosoma sp. KNUC1025]|uniref:helix-turn-helix domain-containing protein n=1 Tax=Spirosoma sp. KNUC1025 TaxID=2894082 RepID=UPI00386CF977|nr:helix-turn-helix domain-containing protein [Spirosoma sp. KNUC1025]
MKDASTRTLIAIDESLFTDIIDTLNDCRIELERGRQREATLMLEVERNKPMPEDQAAEYLGKDVDTLRYYRTLGLESFKKGGSRWYTKSIIDDWLETGRVVQRKRL